MACIVFTFYPVMMRVATQCNGKLEIYLIPLYDLSIYARTENGAGARMEFAFLTLFASQYADFCNNANDYNVALYKVSFH